MLLTIAALAQGLTGEFSHHTVHTCAGSDNKSIEHTWSVGVAF